MEGGGWRWEGSGEAGVTLCGAWERRAICPQGWDGSSGEKTRGGEAALEGFYLKSRITPKPFH